LGHFNEEVADLLGHGVAHIAENKAEVGVYSVPNFFNKHVLRVNGFTDGGWLRVAVGNGSTLGVHLLHGCLGLLSLGYDGATVFLIILIVGEDVVLLGINDCFDKFTSMVALLSQHCGDDVHNNRTHSGESHKDTLNDAACELFELTVDVGEAVKSRLTELLELGLDEIIEDID